MCQVAFIKELLKIEVKAELCYTWCNLKYKTLRHNNNQAIIKCIDCDKLFHLYCINKYKSLPLNIRVHCFVDQQQVNITLNT